MWKKTDIPQSSRNFISPKAAKENTELPVIATLTFDRGPRGFFTMFGITPAAAGEQLSEAGADIAVENERIAGGEPIADIHIKGSRTLKGIHIPEDQVPLAIDEFPSLFIAAACAEGQTVLTGAAARLDTLLSLALKEGRSPLAKSSERICWTAGP